MSVDELIRHALKALKGCIQGDSVRQKREDDV